MGFRNWHADSNQTTVAGCFKTIGYIYARERNFPQEFRDGNPSATAEVLTVSKCDFGLLWQIRRC